MSELQSILDASNAANDKKQAALLLAIQTSAPIAADATRGQAGGEFLAMFLEILKMLLPLLLKLLGG